MWLFTKYGFYSVVEDKEVPENVLIRARAREDLENLKALMKRFFPGSTLATAPIYDSLYSDYRYRVFVPKKDFEAVAQLLVRELDYTNFKHAVGEAGDTGRDMAYMSVWSAMRQWQQRKVTYETGKKWTSQT